MKTIRLTNLAIAVMLFVITSCNNEGMTDPEESMNSNVPTIRATIGDFNDANATVKTKAGIIEDYVHYRDSGERFYWQQGDKIKLLFYNQSNSSLPPVEIDFIAKDPGAKRNTCDFYTPQSVNDLEAGTYDIIGLYPADEWIPDVDEKGVLNAFEVKVSGTYDQIGYTSSHLSKVLFMAGRADDVEVKEKDDYVIDLNFEQVTSVLRFRIIDIAIHKKENFIGPLKLEYLKVYSLDNNPFFVTESYLDGDEWCLFPIVYDNKGKDYIKYKDMLRVNVNEEFYKKGDSLLIDVFMPVLPTGNLGKSGKKMIIDAGLKYDSGDGQGVTIHPHYFGTEGGISFDKDGPFGFLYDGFVGGNSYWLDLTIRK